MQVDFLDEVLARLGQGQAGDRELLECARRAQADPDYRERLRANWPTHRLPIVHEYYCVALLGRGASGAVYKALVLDDPGFVALKVLQFTSAEEEARFREREVEILKALDCPFVSSYRESGLNEGIRYLVMQLVVGVPLDEYLARTERLQDKLRVFQKLCRVVAGLHDNGVIHRDLKPRHVLVDAQDQPWVVDFGISAVRSEDWPTRVRQAQTELGRVLGTIKYMSPEQAWGGLLPVDHRADIWSLGIMLYEIATDGGFPYELGPYGELTGHDALLHRIQSEMPRAPRIRSAAFAEPLETLISRCLTPEPKRRIAAARVLADDLERCLSQEPIRTGRLPWWHRMQRLAIGLAVRRRGAVWSAAISASLLFLFVVTLLGGVRWRTTGPGYSADTRGSLAAIPGLVGDQAVVLVGVSDQTVRGMPELAQRLNLGAVTQSLTSWRAVHGHVMEVLAAAAPRAVVWDFYFPSTQPDDARFAQGARTLYQEGVPVVIGVLGHNDDGTPQVSRSLFDAAGPSIRYGLAFARHMVAREGEFLLALRRGETVYASLALSAFAATAHPDRRLLIDWEEASKTIRLIYHSPTGARAEPTVDRVGLTTVNRSLRQFKGIRSEDVLGSAAFPLQPPQRWERRVVPYEDLLTLDAGRLKELVAGRIVLFGDVRGSSSRPAPDRHRVRYGTTVVDHVPGCYLVADALSGLLSNRYLRPELSVSTFLLAGLAGLTSCFLAVRLARLERFRSPRFRSGVVAGLLVVAAVSTVVLVLTRTQTGVYTALLSTAVSQVLVLALLVESARDPFRARRAAR